MARRVRSGPAVRAAATNAPQAVQQQPQSAANPEIVTVIGAGLPSSCLPGMQRGTGEQERPPGSAMRRESAKHPNFQLQYEPDVATVGR